MSLLDDPALGLPAAARRASQAQRPRVRFRPGSTYARELLLPAEASGAVTGHYRVGGFDKLTIHGDGWFATEVPVGEVMNVHATACADRTGDFTNHPLTPAAPTEMVGT